MQINFISPAVLVRDVERSRQFYEEVLGQTVEMDNGEHVAFVGGFSIWQGEHAYGMIFGADQHYASGGAKEFELYFETEELEQAWQNSAAAGVETIHPIHEHPWGQRGFRLYDPDGHMVEIAEPLSCVVKRFLAEGLTIAEIAQRTSIPEPMVEAMA